jgi:hypothetical protein
VNYLEVFLEPKLNLSKHLREKWKKIYSMWACRRVMALGINPKIAIWMYQTVLPQKLYASVVCWPMVSRVEAKNLLQNLQSSYLRAAVGSMKITPIEMMEVSLPLIPLDLAVIGATRFTAYRLNCQEEWRNTGLGQIKLFLQKYPFILKQDKMLKKYQVVKQCKALISTIKCCCMPGKNH